MNKLTRLLVVGLTAGLCLSHAPAPPQAEAAELADLEVFAVAVGDSGAVVYQVGNRGEGGTQRPFVVDVYVNGIRKDSITHGPLPALSVQAAQSNLARVTECKAGTVRLVLDPQNSVREASKTNNERTVQLSPPCARSSR